MNSDIEDDFFFPSDNIDITIPPPVQPIEPAEQLIQNIEEQIGPSNINHVSTFVDQAPTITPPSTDNQDSTLHPFDAMQNIVRRLETVIRESTNRMADEDGAKWASVYVSALKEARMSLKDILPRWDEWQSKQNVIEETWVDHLMNFNLNFIKKNLGEDMIIDYMKEWDEWQSKFDTNTQ